MPLVSFGLEARRAVKTALLATAMAGLLAGCSASSIDRLSSDSDFSANPDNSGAAPAQVAAVPADNVEATPLAGAPVGQTFASTRAAAPAPVPAQQVAGLPPAMPVNEPAPVVTPEPSPAPAPTPIAQAAPTEISATPHKVKEGETLYSLARSYKVKPAAIADLNQLPHDATLKVGQNVLIPDSGEAAVADAAPAEAVPAEAAPDEAVAGGEVAAEANVEKPKQVASHSDPAAPVTDETASEEPAATASTTAAAQPEVAAPSGPSFRWPVQGRVISGFGAKPDGTRNEGINISVPAGTSVRAAEDGVVAYAGNELKGYGNLVLIRHDGGYVTAYAHNSELMVKRGQTIKRGDVIAKAGQTGSVEAPQLHFEVRKGATALDPTKFLASSAATN